MGSILIDAAQVILLITFLLTFILLVLSLIPIDLEFDLVAGDKRKTDARVVWLFGLVKKSVAGSMETELVDKTEHVDKTGHVDAAGRADGSRAGKAKSEGGMKWSDVSGLLGDLGFARRVLRFFEDALGSLKVVELRARIRFGFEDPADTGTALGYLCALSPLLGGADLSIKPCFGAEIFEGGARGALRLKPYTLLISSVRFLASVPTLRSLLRLAGRWWRVH